METTRKSRWRRHLAISFFVLTVAICAFAWLSLGRQTLTTDDAARLKMGMSEAEAFGALGIPPDLHGQFVSHPTMVYLARWEVRDGTIDVGFDGNKQVNHISADPEWLGWLMLRRLLEKLPSW